MTAHMWQMNFEVVYPFSSRKPKNINPAKIFFFFFFEQTEKKWPLSRLCLFHFKLENKLLNCTRNIHITGSPLSMCIGRRWLQLSDRPFLQRIGQLTLTGYKRSESLWTQSGCTAPNPSRVEWSQRAKNIVAQYPKTFADVSQTQWCYVKVALPFPETMALFSLWKIDWDWHSLTAE